MPTHAPLMMDRRRALALGMGGLAALAVAPQAARAASVAEVTAAFAGGATPVPGDAIRITAPEIAENGNAVPVSVDAPGATAVLLIGDGNPEAAIAAVTFGPAAGSRSFATRVRLAQTQNVIVLARMEDGSVQTARAAVKVTIGGCGG